jgi:signal transduction histidine kinase
LVANAIESCGGGSQPGAGKAVVLRTVAPEDLRAVEYQVTDTGCGMDDTVRSKLFQSFFSTKGTRGTGIGLMMVKKIVDQHGGVIDVQSQPGKGTTIRIRLPRRVP